VAAALGYSNYGLRALAQRVLGAQMPKAAAVRPPLAPAGSGARKAVRRARTAGAYEGWERAPCVLAPAAGAEGCLLRSAPAGLSLGVAPHGGNALCVIDYVRF